MINGVAKAGAALLALAVQGPALSAHADIVATILSAKVLSTHTTLQASRFPIRG
jgi:hypothetical protein